MGRETESTTPCSTPAEPQLKAPKDKNCPFCGQAFTSSSLGRHLDLYIRPKNPKAPDGIHIVQEIRKLRGGITRRQAKGSVSGPKDDSAASTPATQKQSIASEDSATLVQSPEEEDGDGGDDDDDGLQLGKSRGQFKDVSWGKSSRQPSRALGARTPDMRRDVSRQLQKADLDTRHKMSEESEIASATEMALKELLRSMREVNAKASGSHLFDFDPYALNFPSLCLQILPSPSTLFSPTPFPTPESWSITPPGQKQLEALNKHVRERLLAQQRQRQINQVYPSGSQSAASSTTSSPLPTPPLFDPDPQRLFCHIADAYNHWIHQTDQTRQEYWQVEILRCFARAEDRRREAEVQLEHARREIDYLKANRWSSGAPDVSPLTINLGVDTARELGRYGMDFRNWDYDRLIEKCRGVIREGKVAAASGLAAQKPLPGAPSSTRSFSMASLPPHAFSAASQLRQGSPIKSETNPFAAPPTVNDGSNGDQLDAEGDDDEDINLDQQHTPPEKPMGLHQPSMQQQQQEQQQEQQQQHHITIQPTPIHPSQQLQAHMHNQMHMNSAQLHAQAQAWAAARQHMNQSRNQNYSPHHQQHQQISPHVQHVQSHLGSASSSRRPSVQFSDPHNLNASLGMTTGMEGIENHADQFLRLDMSLAAGFVGGNDGGVSLG